MLRVLSAFILVAFVAATIVAVSDSLLSAQGTIEKRIDDKQGELGKIKREIEDLRRKTRALAKREEDELETLSSLDKEIALSRSFLSNLLQQEALINQQIDSLKVEILYETEALEGQEETLARRLRQMYKRDPNHTWDIVLGGESIQDAMRRYKFLRIVVERDAAMVNEYRSHKLSLETQTAAMTESLAEMTMVRAEREEENSNLESAKDKREKVIADIRGQKSKHAKAIARLEKAQKEVQDLIGQLEKRRSGSALDGGDFAKLKGNLPWPVAGRLKRGFGESKHPRYGTVTFNNGVDIAAAAGSPIQAVATGIVEFVDWIDAYGKCIIINHGDGYYTLYAHVARTMVDQGQHVSYGDVIAEVGDSGSLDGFGCHFEVRHSKKALNPIQWLEGSLPPRS